MPIKRPFFFDMNTGAWGTFVKTERGNKPDHVNVIYAPGGFFGAFKHAKIFNVPESAVPEPLYSPDASQAGVENSGYVILPKGQDGKAALADKLNMFLDKRIAQIQAAKTRAEMEAKIQAQRARAAAKGSTEELKRLSQLQDSLSKGKGYGDDRPFMPPERRRPFEEEE